MTGPVNAPAVMPSRALFGLLGALAFLVMAGYAVARPAIESMFIEAYTSSALPGAWIAVGITATAVVVFYNRMAGSALLGDLFVGTFGVSVVSFVVLLAAFRFDVPYAAFALYVWKDVYIVILVEIFWSFANAVYGTESARWTYGLFCVMGSVGGMAANLGIGALSQSIGTVNAIWLLIPILLFSAALAMELPALGRPAIRGGSDETPRFGEGLRLIRKSRYLGLILGLIVIVQMVVTLIDYQYNVMIEAAYPDTDARTAVMGQVYALIDVGSMSLQLLTGVVLAWLGVTRTLLAIPALVGAAVAAFAIAPRFLTMAVAKVASKSFDYSLFRAAKEILYIPLSYPEKTQGKAFIDMLTYRVAKAGASILLLVLAGGWVVYVTLALVGCWFVVIRRIAVQYRTRVASAG